MGNWLIKGQLIDIIVLIDTHLWYIVQAPQYTIKEYKHSLEDLDDTDISPTSSYQSQSTWQVVVSSSFFFLLWQCQ